MVKKILIIRTLKTELLKDIITCLKEKLKNDQLEIDLFTHPDQHTLSYLNNIFKNIIIYDSKKDFSNKYISQSKLKKLKDEKYDLIIIPQMFKGTNGFAEVIMLAYELKPKDIAFIAINPLEIMYLKKNIKLAIKINKIFSTLIIIPLQIFFWGYFSFLFFVKKLNKN